MTENITEEDVSSGRLADLLDHVGHDVRKKIDEVTNIINIFIMISNF